ncbi:MAG: tRNA 2-thiouridine(34) synthase MnmA [Chlamydiales bacterium]|nr:tRNA 2-thiouridine(34) synthase MnmA [Chlamydiales bacterium]
MKDKKTVVVGMSGGVDSSVAAYLLKEQGYNVIGLYMKNWEEEDGSGACHGLEDYEDVVRVCDQLGVPYYSVSFAKEYWDLVFTHFLEELKQGYTPNPDILCNREIKFKLLLDKALALGGDYLATGHYCQLDEKKTRLLKGLDPQKDQSYFLYTLTEKQLPSLLFPVGGLEKAEVRALAKKAGLATAQKKDSVGICFIGKRDFKSFLGRYLTYQKGSFQTLDGKRVGEHDGVAYYTLGQRKGLGIGGPGDAWFVVAKDLQRNIVFVEQGKDHPALYTSSLTATEASWVNGPPLHLPFRCRAKVRYRQEDQECIITRIDGDKIEVSFPQPQRAVTPRQSIVFYQDSICLGGAMIAP